jgi:hypothetical protein
MSSQPFMSMGPYVRIGASLTEEKESIQYGQEILELLDAELAPMWVTVICCQGNDKGDRTIAHGNPKADREAKKATLTRGLTQLL